MRLEIRDTEGRVIGTRQVVADAGGNWMAHFPTTTVWGRAHEMRVEQTGTANDTIDAVYRPSRWFQPAAHPSMTFVYRSTVTSVIAQAAGSSMDAMMIADKDPTWLGR